MRGGRRAAYWSTTQRRDQNLVEGASDQARDDARPENADGEVSAVGRTDQRRQRQNSMENAGSPASTCLPAGCRRQPSGAFSFAPSRRAPRRHGRQVPNLPSRRRWGVLLQKYARLQSYARLAPRASAWARSTQWFSPGNTFPQEKRTRAEPTEARLVLFSYVAKWVSLD